FKAVVTEVDQDLNIHFRIVTTDGSPQPISIINQTITQALRERECLTPFTGHYEVGRACTAYFDFDQTWNRAEIQGVVRDETTNCGVLTVRFVDYGNVDQLFTEKLSSDVFNIEIPKLGLYGQLHNCKLFDESLRGKLMSEMNAILVDKTLKFRWENYMIRKFPMKISIYLPNDEDLKQVLLNKDLIVEDNTELDDLPSSIQHVLEVVKRSPYEANHLSFSLNVYYPVVVSYPTIYNYIYLQAVHINDPIHQEECMINEQNEKFLSSIERMRADVRSFKWVGENLNKGEAVCAKFSDDCWYRGLILKVNRVNRTADVLYVDYGNTDTVSFVDLKELPPYHVKIPPIHTFLAKLYNIRPANKKYWSDNHARMIGQALEELDNPLVAIFKKTEAPFEVDLYEASENDPRVPIRHALQKLVDRGYLEFIEPANVSSFLSYEK
ncbi:tudor domain-containing protein 1-like protein, partial [Dinothrombium tinctorium]